MLLQKLEKMSSSTSNQNLQGWGRRFLFNLFIITIIYFLTAPCSMQDLQFTEPGIETTASAVEARSLDHWTTYGSPRSYSLKRSKSDSDILPGVENYWIRGKRENNTLMPHLWL